MMDNGQAVLGMAGVGFFGMLLIGFLAGWIAERVMNRDHGLLTNILVGIAGSFVGGTLAGLLGFQWYGFIGNLAVATIGAIGILWFFGKRETARIRETSRFDTPAPRRGEEVETNSSNRPHTPIYHAADETGKKDS